MITKCIILGGGFGEAKYAETLRDELPLDQADLVHFSRENPSRLQLTTGGSRRLRRANALENHRVEIERRWTR
jgi:hypothetical protein